jgi:hypothetical protein
MKQILFIIFIYIIGFQNSKAQTSHNRFKIDTRRQLFHDYVDREQKRLLGLDGLQDDVVSLSKDETINTQVAYSLINQLDVLQEKIETDTNLADNGKIKYIRGLETLVNGFNNNVRRKDFAITVAPELVNAFAAAMQYDRKNESIEPIVQSCSYEAGKLLVECFTYPENIGIKACRQILAGKQLENNPQEILPYLQRNPDLPGIDSLLALAARDNPSRFYDYASASDRLANRIRNSEEPFVKILGKIASSRSGQLYFPFLDMLLDQRISFEEIDAVKESNVGYYKLLVKTRISFAGRLLKNRQDTINGITKLTQMLSNKAKDVFISEINGRHESANEAYRYQCLEPLTPQELYYLCVLGEDEIYTSSYLGVFKRIFQRMKVPRGDSLIMSVNTDYFRKFIKMAAGYGKLDTLLKTMPPDDATTLMRAFMSRLELTTNTMNVEDAVDVADSYSSIFETNKKMAKRMRQEARLNYERCATNKDKNGMVIYQLERILFESADTTKGIDVSAELGIPPVYAVDYNSLTDDSGRVIQQVFFYGDKDQDGQNSYANFKAMFAGKANWKMNETGDWLIVKSTKGKKVWIFANRPLLGADDPDQKAQEKLNEYLQSQGLAPTIYIHRGHSYHVKYSLRQLQRSGRIVILGSCGGYNNLNDVLSISSDAHIISSKQVGTKAVNEPILEAINNRLLNGRNVDWLPLWKEVAKKIPAGEAKERFKEYVPPYKNLGAIFIKAYRIAMNE